MSVTLRADTETRPRPREHDSGPPNGFIPALFSGGDSRIAADPRSGLNKYFCPAEPAPDLVCVASCTASPVSAHGFDRAAEAFLHITRAPSLAQRAERLAELTGTAEARLLRYFGAGGLAQVVLCPSGTDALLTTTLLLAAERPDETMTAILPAASETGTGVPLAAQGRLFDGADSGRSLAGWAAQTVEIPLRRPDGSPRSEAMVNEAFAAAAAQATGRVILWLTHGSKTGLIAPTTPPDGADVIVDACQARIEPRTVVAYLRRGWPVVVTGSKFFGGPAFSGAILFPQGRLRLPAAPAAEPTRFGTVLRWTAALAEIEAFEPHAATAAAGLASRIISIEQALAANPALMPVGGQPPRGTGWADLPSIFTFGVRDPRDRSRLLSVAELRPIYERLARGGVLLGQPVSLGAFGGLRLAIGARDLLETPGRLGRVFTALEAVARPH